MEVFCKKTYIDTNTNFFKIQGAGYGEKYTKWKCDTLYEARIYEALDMNVATIFSSASFILKCLIAAFSKPFHLISFKMARTFRI